MRLKINKTLLYILQAVMFVGVFYVFFNASIGLVVFPFAFGILFALAWANQKVWLIVPAYIIAGVLYQQTLEFAICTLVCAFCLIVPYFIHVLCKKNMKKWEFAVYAIISQTAHIVFDILQGVSPLLGFVGIVFGVLFMFACMIVFEAMIIRGFTNKLTSLELISLFTIIGAFCSGLAVLNIAEFSLVKFFVALAILIFSYCSTLMLTFLTASVAGIGCLVATSNPIFVAPFVVWALVGILFKQKYKSIMAIAVICVEVVLIYYFKLYNSTSYLELLPTVLSSVVFVLIPKRFCQEIATIFNLSNDRIAMKNVVNRNREILHRRLGNLSEIFNDMNQIYRNLLKSGMTVDQVKEILQQEIKEKICSYCPERNHCHRTFEGNTKKVFDELITISFEKGKATLLDIPTYLTSRCKQTNAILGSINTLTAQYKKYMNMVRDVDTSKLIIADQLLGVSKIMGELSKEVDTMVSFDGTREGKILDELTYHNIICIDAVVFEKDVWTQNVSLVVRDSDSEKPRIADVVTKVCDCKMAVSEIYPSSRPGYSIVNLKTAPRFDCIFGVAQKKKNGSKVSGDNYSVVKLDGERILFAISDGMGSGQKAEEASELSISLIENFYKAGFDNELILSTVNKLLNLHKQEIFSAIDICVLDEKNGIADFIKMAAPNSVILNKNSCRNIEAGALPMGVVEEINPLISKNVVEAKDFIVLFSDGISDSFAIPEDLIECIKSIKTKNPQEFADELLERALSNNNGYAVDDMTVLAIKII